MWKFEIYKDKAGEPRFRLKAWNGQIILASQWYSSKAACENGIESVRKNSQTDERFERKDTKTWCKFTLMASNGQPIGQSEVYTTKAACEKGIASVAKNAPEARIIEVDA